MIQSFRELLKGWETLQIIWDKDREATKYPIAYYL